MAISDETIREVGRVSAANAEREAAEDAERERKDFYVLVRAEPGRTMFGGPFTMVEAREAVAFAELYPNQEVLLIEGKVL